MQQPSLIREVLLVMERELRAMFLSVRSIFLALIYGSALVTSFWAGIAGFRKLRDKFREQVAAQGGSNFDADIAIDQAMKSDSFRDWMQEQVLPWAQGAGPETELAVRSLGGGEVPWSIVLGVIVSGAVLPPLLLLISYDRVSSDLSIKYTRYLLQRIRRGSYIVGKLLGQWVVILGIVLVVQALALLLGAGVPELAVSEMIPHLPAAWVGTSLALLAYLSFFTIYSVWFDRSFLSLMVGGVGYFVVTIFGWASAVGQVWIGRWDFRVALLQPSAIAVALANTAVFLGISYVIMRRRDV